MFRTAVSLGMCPIAPAGLGAPAAGATAPGAEGGFRPPVVVGMAAGLAAATGAAAAGAAASFLVTFLAAAAGLATEAFIIPEAEEELEDILRGLC